MRLGGYGLRFAVIAFAMACASCASVIAPQVSTDPTEIRPGAYQLDQQHASIIFKIGHLGFSDYVGRFNRFDASLDFNVSEPTATRVDAVIEINSLDVANDAFAETLTGPGWFNAQEHPQAVFQSNRLEVTGENTGNLHGDLTLNGITQPVVMDVTFNGGGFDILRNAYIVGVSAETEIQRSAFGLRRFIPLVSDDVTLEIEAEFMRQTP